MTYILKYFRYSFILIVLVLSANVVLSQQESSSDNSGMDHAPSFEGGKDKLTDFINSYMFYPQQAFYDSIEGTVVISFTVDKNGLMKDLAISKSVSHSLDSEAMRVVKLMSQVLKKWTPGIRDGKKVSMKDSLEVNFNIHDYEQARHVYHYEKIPTPGFDIHQFLRDHLKYPYGAKSRNKSGTVLVKFIINEDGSLSDFQIARSVDPDLDAEAIRVIKLMPKWNPGRQWGRPVKVTFTQPVRFSLN